MSFGKTDESKFGRKCKDCGHFKKEHLWTLEEQSMFWAAILSPFRVLTPKESRGHCQSCSCEKYR